MHVSDLSSLLSKWIDHQGEVGTPVSALLLFLGTGGSVLGNHVLIKLQNCFCNC